MQNGVLIIDDETKLAGLLGRIIGLEGFQVFEANKAKDGLKVLSQEDILVVITDIKLPDIKGIELVTRIKEIKPYVEVICVTAYGTIPDGVQAMKNGAFDYLTKGDDNEKLLPLLYKAYDKAVLQLKLYQLENKAIKRYSFKSILGKSKPIRQAIELAEKVSLTNTTVLLLGETGTGKELFAQAIHYNSPRNHKNFVAVNCSAFSKELLESELFGHKAGAFTSAVKEKKGLFEEANGGTIFLDEIGEMNLELQAKLLRVLESGEFIKVGDTRVQTVNVRIIAATNRDLNKEIEKERFRADLFYRLSVFSITLPSLSQRKDDIPILVNHYLKEFSTKLNNPIKETDPAFLKALEDHEWKGNIRELRNLIERAVIVGRDKLTTHVLPFDFFTHAATSNTIFDMAAMEKEHIAKVMRYTHGNKTETARLLNIGLTTLYRKIEEYQIA
ncbi:sigma-54 dependent transcriptional regulator [Mucilaginibacter sp. RS28]|uniref:Sigma-54 dependent transcriptional regulator n=1 Tax=Mucilaginibacter straminoryzae TaxID=2932774 RepID=A0A9X1X206_9SPHI|nr:sigma-54 dependent transcriptional regulator [Mucilaginibacter straminoryzae]MCJ8209782.1 sigma-54 dependent transcriptional regulator [Mucilaginibacter straminoryzae]